MNRDSMLSALEGEKEWDIIVIGGGATGLGIAVDAASRGYRTLLVEKYDFAKGTSSRSTKLIHGGVRYLARGDIKLVREALYERGLLLKNAPHLSRLQEFLIPAYHWWEKGFYGIGLNIYDALAGQRKLGHTKWVSLRNSISKIPVINQNHLRGGVSYFDGQFDDARLAIGLAATAASLGAVLLNYCPVKALLKEGKKVCGVAVADSLGGKEFEVHGKVVINATGVFVDEILQMETGKKEMMVTPSQGVHLVVDKRFFPGQTALMIPKTEDKRVLFAVPWYNKVVVGTTDTPVGGVSPEPRALEEEIEFILHHFNKYTTAGISRKEVGTVFAGLRPLVKSADAENTALLSRDHTILVSAGGLVTITGGKWTTYRKMAKDAVNNAIRLAGLHEKPCITEGLHIHGWVPEKDPGDPLHHYGSDAHAIRAIVAAKPALSAPLHPDFPIMEAEVIWAAREEMAVNIEDVLARRTRLLFLDARAAMTVAPVVAELMRQELKKHEAWKAEQLQSFRDLAMGYIL